MEEFCADRLTYTTSRLKANRHLMSSETWGHQMPRTNYLSAKTSPTVSSVGLGSSTLLRFSLSKAARRA